MLSEEGAQDFLRLCPTAEYISVTGAGHMVAGALNDIFAASVIEFLGRAVPIGRQPVQPPQPTTPIEDGDGQDIIDVP